MRPADKLFMLDYYTESWEQSIIQYGDAFLSAWIHNYSDGRWATSLGFVFGKSIPLLYVTALERY